VENVSNFIKEIFEKEASELKAVAKFSQQWDFVPYTHSLDDEVILEIKNAIESTGLKANPVVSFGGSDANSLNAKGIKAVNIGIGAQNPHSVDEFILIEDLIKTAEIAGYLISKK
jgi:tripeptide aminopeptidase